MFTLLIFILGKDSNTSILQLSILAVSKPMVSLIAFYANSTIINRPQKIKLFLLTASLLSVIPCLLFPFVHSNWFYVGSFVLFTAASRTAFPAWSELLKRHVGMERMGRLVSKGTSIHYSMILFLPFLLSFWMDMDASYWKRIFFILALIHLANIILILLTPTFSNLSVMPPQKSNLNPKVLAKQTYGLIKTDPFFAKYLLIFFFGGAGIVALQPILPIYFRESLNLSFKQLTLAFSFCKGVGFVMTSPFWAHKIHRISIYLLNGWMNVFTLLFMICLLVSSLQIEWLFIGYLFYGTMQAGCELSWNLSGPIFSKKKESILFSSINLILVGLRGCVCPFIGQWLFHYSGSFAVFSFAIITCIFSLFYALRLNRIYKRAESAY
jgi:hypothetical protein